jgi:hypothetical protein
MANIYKLPNGVAINLEYVARIGLVHDVTQITQQPQSWSFDIDFSTRKFSRVIIHDGDKEQREDRANAIRNEIIQQWEQIH